MATYWTPERDQFLRDNYLSMSSYKMANKLRGTSGSGVRNRMIRLNLRLSDDMREKRIIDGLTMGAEARRNKIGPHPFPGFSIYTITYFAHLHSLEKVVNVQKKNNKPNFVRVLDDVCAALNVPKERVILKSRKMEYVWARYIFCYVCRKLYRKAATYDKLAAYVGYREHTMALHAINIMKGGIRRNDPGVLPVWYRYLANTQLYKTRHVQHVA